jgi:hypothetical protein
VGLARVLEGFLELPKLVVLGAMWLVGGALLGGCVLVPYFLWTVLA